MTDYAELWGKMASEPNIKPGAYRIALSNDEEWILWESWKRKGQYTTCRYLGHGKDFLRASYKRLESQGGPKGEKPAWMK